MKRLALFAPVLILLACQNAPPPAPGDPVDNLDGVVVYHGAIPETPDAEQPFSSVEFVHRYYEAVMQYPIEGSLQSAIDFFDPSVPDGEINHATGLTQYTLPSMAPPRKGDILIFGPAKYNPGGHLAIVAEVSAKEIVIVQQNPGPLAKVREPLRYYLRKKKWYVQHPHVIGWLHKEE
jgi:hypothetical protein